jgi:hypothetical protein
MELLSRNISCPYCGESIDLLIDDSATDQDYFEDCSVCCRPIRVQVSVDFAGECEVVVLRDDE